jgi:hypothetical protein
LNISNILCVTAKPPPIFTADANTAEDAKAVAVVVGKIPPPMQSIPPTAVKPEMALVTDIRGLCNAGTTPHTVWYPATLERPNLVTMDEKAAPGEAMPSAMRPARPPVAVNALLMVSP